MKKFFSISEAAEIAEMTSETLRYYDRIGLVKPGIRDEHTGYRYYSEKEIVRLNTIQALRYMDLSLAEIKRILELDNLEEVIAFFKQAERKADEKIVKLQRAKEKIRLARVDYEKKSGFQQETGALFTQRLPVRTILLSDTMQHPTLDNLWNYLAHFYHQLPPEQKDAYEFEDLAGTYTRENTSRLFAVCRRFPENQGLTVLPAGSYICANCAEEEKERVLEHLLEAVREQYGMQPEFFIHMIVITGILQWNYQIQVLVEPEQERK